MKVKMIEGMRPVPCLLCAGDKTYRGWEMTGPTGAVFLCDYCMVYSVEGIGQINGCDTKSTRAGVKAKANTSPHKCGFCELTSEITWTVGKDSFALTACLACVKTMNEQVYAQSKGYQMIPRADS